MADRNANIIVTLRSNADAETRKLSSSFRELIQQTRAAGASQEQAERKALSHAQALARLAVASGQAAQGEKVLVAALSQVDRESTAAIRAQTQLTNIQNRGVGVAGQLGDALKGSMLSVIGPAALAAAALAGVRQVVQSFRDAFAFKVELDATNQSIANQLKGVRDSGRVFQEAERFGRQYRITQAETSQILQNSVGILRTSTAGVAELESVLIRLQSRSPAKPISEAARALRELNTGDVTTIKEIFDVGAADALRMKNEIAGGADAVQVLSRYLTDAGNGMEVLEQRTRGATGAINEQKVAQEDLMRAQAEFAAGPGLALLQLQTNITRGFARGFTLDTSGLQEGLAHLEAMAAAQRAYDAALQAGQSDEQARIAGTEAYAARARELEPIENAVARAAQAAGDTLNALVPVLKDTADAHQAGAVGAFAQAEQLDGLSRQARGATIALIGLRASQDAVDAKARQASNATGIERLAKGFGAGAGTGAAEQAEKIRAARAAQALALAKTDAQRIGLLQQELALTTDTVKRIQLETEIAQLRNNAAKSHTKELGTQLNLEERIADSKEKQLRSAIDARLAINDDAKQDILDAQRLQRNQNTIANAKDPNIRALAALDSDRVPLEDAKRALDIREQLATAGGQVVNGKIIQGQRGGALPALPGGAVGLPALPGLPAGVGGGSVPIVHVYLDSQEISKKVVVELQSDLDAVRGAGAGRTP
jgi:hypothetical protein